MYVVWAKSPRCLLCILGGSLFSAVMAFPCDNVHTYRTIYRLEYAANFLSCQTVYDFIAVRSRHHH